MIVFGGKIGNFRLNNCRLIIEIHEKLDLYRIFGLKSH